MGCDAGICFLLRAARRSQSLASASVPSQKCPEGLNLVPGGRLPIIPSLGCVASAIGHASRNPACRIGDTAGPGPSSHPTGSPTARIEHMRHHSLLQRCLATSGPKCCFHGKQTNLVRCLHTKSKALAHHAMLEGRMCWSTRTSRLLYRRQLLGAAFVRRPSLFANCQKATIVYGRVAFLARCLPPMLPVTT